MLRSFKKTNTPNYIISISDRK